MIKLSQIKRSIKQGNLKAENTSISSKLTLCFNFLEIPNEPLYIMTLSVLINNHRSNAMVPMDFARTVSSLERILDKVAEQEHITDDILCNSLHGELENTWYKVLDCHRVFLIPMCSLWVVIKELYSLLNPKINYISINIKDKGTSSHMDIKGGTKNESIEA